MSNWLNHSTQTKENSSNNTTSRYILALYLGLALFGLYFLTYSGHFESSDSVSIYAVTESIAKRGAFDTGSFIWDRWTAGYQDAQGDFGADGEIYSKKGLGASILAAPFTWLALRIPGIGLIQTTYVFNIVITALTAIILFFYVLRLGYSKDVALLTGALFGTATLAWPYAGYFYSEPLMGFLLLLAAYYLLLFHQNNHLAYLFGGGLAVGWAAVTRLTNLILLPVYFIYALGPITWHHFVSIRRTVAGNREKTPPWQTILRNLIVLSVPVGTGLLIIALYNYLRFQTPFRSGYAQTAGFWTPLDRGLYGFFLSPEKSLFLYAPILLLPVASLPLFLKRHTREALFLLSLFILPAMLFAKWMDWEGGLAWGPRYLVALVPLIMPLAAPGLAWLLSQPPFHQTSGKKIWLRRGLLAGLIMLTLWSITIQTFAASINFVHYLRIPRELADNWQGSPLALSPPLLPWFLPSGLLNRSLIDLAWFNLITPETLHIAWEPLVLTICFILLALFALLWFRSHPPSRRTAIILGTGSLLLALLLAVFNLHGYYNSPTREAGDDYMRLVDYLARHEKPDDVLLVSSHVYMGFFMNYNHARMQWYSLLSKEENPSPDETVLLERVLQRHPRIWLAIDRVPELNLPRPAEKWLTQHAYKIDERIFSDYSRLCLYSTAGSPDPQTPQHPANVNLGHGIRLKGYDVYTGSAPETLETGDTLRFSLLWEATGTPDGDFIVFAQLIHESDGVIWQSDRRPVDGFRPTQSWQPGELIRDNYGLVVRGDWPEGDYSLIAGMYNPQNGERLPMRDQEGSVTGDHITLSRFSTNTSRLY